MRETCFQRGSLRGEYSDLAILIPAISLSRGNSKGVLFSTKPKYVAAPGSAHSFVMALVFGLPLPECDSQILVACRWLRVSPNIKRA